MQRAAVRSVSRALDILVGLEHGPQSVSALARTTGLSAVTTRRLLASLAHRDLVVPDRATPTFRLGPGCFRILDAVVRGAGGLDVIAAPVLSKLAEETGETVALYVRAGPRRICVAQVPSPQPVRFTARLGMDNPLHTGAMGKVLLAFSEAAEREEILDRTELTAYTPATITDRATLERELAKIRQAGHAESRGERSVGVAAIAAPVFDVDGRVLAALSILGPSERLSDETLAALRKTMIAAARECTRRVASSTSETGSRRR